MSAMNKMLGILLLAALAMAGGACYPDEDGRNGADLSGLRLPLGEWGIALQTESLNRWVDWLDAGGGFAGTTFDMSRDGNNFALGLHLSSMQSEQEIGFIGDTIVLDQSSGEDVLWLDMTVTDCSECWFDVVIFWRDADVADVIRTFSGSSNLFDLSAGSLDNPSSVIVDAYQQAVGEIRCMPGSQAVPPTARLAIRDVQENVRLLSTPVLAGQSPLATLAGAPIERDLMVELDSLGDGLYFSDIESVYLVSEGQVGTVELP